VRTDGATPELDVEGRVPIAFPEFSWRQACDRPGAVQMIHLRNLMLSRPFLSRIPDQSMLASGEGEGALHAQATRDADGSYALIYIPTAQQTVSLDIRTLAGTQATAWWYDPRRGQAARIGTYAMTQIQDFTTPASGPDWVLVLDDSSRNFAAPGQRV
jgi:Putative collagen-binding domain of a collagenase